MIPTRGAVVDYILTVDDAEKVNKRRSDAYNSKIARRLISGTVVHVGDTVMAEDVYPMVIVDVVEEDEDPGTVKGQVVLPGNDILWVTSDQGEGPGTWSGSISEGGSSVDPSGDQTITSAWDFTDATAYEPAFYEYVGLDQDQNPVPNTGIRFEVAESAIDEAYFGVEFRTVDYTIPPFEEEWAGRSTLTVIEDSDEDLGLLRKYFGIILPTVDGLGNDLIDTTANEVVAAFNVSSAAGRVTATLGTGSDGTGIIPVPFFPFGIPQPPMLEGGSRPHHVEVEQGVITSPVTIYPSEIGGTVLTLRPKLGSVIGTAVLNIEYHDGTPNGPSGYGVSHLDSDGGGALAGEKISWSQAGNLVVEPDVEDLGGGAAFRVGTSFYAGGVGPSVSIGTGDAARVGLEIYPYTDATADVMVFYDPTDGSTKRFRVTPMGEVHARGGLVLTSPDGTPFLVTVTDAGVLSVDEVV